MRRSSRARVDSNLTPEAWRRLEDLLDHALDLPEAERVAFLGRSCGTGPIRNQLESLLAAHEETEGPLERLAQDLRRFPSQVPAEAPGPGERVGAYELLEVIGQGGMGVVYRAQRADGEFQQEVALKLISNPLSDPVAGQRFLAERQILALISHPNVARLLDGGLTQTGHPFFTMELVQGDPLDVYCNRLQLDVDDRLRLFLTVCEAVAAVHRNLVVHRDLKPSNILVTTGGRGEPPGVVKLLDFGIAKLVEPDGPSSGLTGTAFSAFTPDYASPEQVRGEIITTASDVYSLGAVLYGLLTGTRAHRFDSNAPPATIRQAICERIPPPPSLAVSEAACDAGAPSRERLTRIRASRPERLRRRLQGDLDTIVLKALHKDPCRRYPSVGELRADLLRHLEGLPIRARPDDWHYRLGKFLRRHRTAAAAAALLALTLAAGWTTTSLEARRAERQERLAAQQRDRAQEAVAREARVTGLLKEVFRIADPARQPGETVSARQLLEEGTRRIEAELGEDPETRADLLEVVGEIYHNLALYPQAEQVLERCLELRQTLLHATADELCRVLLRLAQLHFDRSRYSEAESRFGDVLEVKEVGAEARAAALRGLGLVSHHTGRFEEAEKFLRQALALQQSLPDSSPGEQMELLNDLAVLLHERGGSREAEELFRRAVEIGQSRGAVHLQQAIAQLHLAQLVHFLDGGAVRAEPLYREALTAARSLFSEDHPQVASSLNGLAVVLKDLGRPEEALGPAQESLAMWCRLHREPHREISVARHTLASLFEDLGRFEESETLMRQELASRRELFGPQSTEVMVATSALAGLLDASGRHRKAEALHREALALARELYAGDHAFVVRGLTLLARNLLLGQRPQEAEELLREALAQRLRLHAGDHWRIDSAKVELGRALIGTGRLGEARRLLSEAHDGLLLRRGKDSQEARKALEALAHLEDAERARREAEGRRDLPKPLKEERADA